MFLIVKVLVVSRHFQQEEGLLKPSPGTVKFREVPLTPLIADCRSGRGSGAGPRSPVARALRGQGQLPQYICR